MLLLIEGGEVYPARLYPTHTTCTSELLDEAVAPAKAGAYVEGSSWVRW